MSKPQEPIKEKLMAKGKGLKNGKRGLPQRETKETLPERSPKETSPKETFTRETHEEPIDLYKSVDKHKEKYKSVFNTNNEL